MQSMNDKLSGLTEIVHQRKSVRGFTNQPVDSSTLTSIFELAQQTPSNCNTQPWFSHVVSGASCERLKTSLVEASRRGEFTLDFPYAGKYDGVFKERQYDAAAQLYQAMGVERGDRDARQAAFSRNFSFFGAPHAVFLFMSEDFGAREAADVGMYAQSLLLAMSAQGLASCPQTALGFHADLVRKELSIDAQWKLLFGISFGYEDKTAAANNAHVGRAVLSDAVVFHH